MLLNGQDIRDRKLIENSSESRFFAASYNLGIGKILPPAGGETDSYLLPPQGMVEVVSTERVQLPANVAGYATVKTSLCNDGILAINIGILDPLYHGLISSTIINFGNKPYRLRANDPFLRLTFHQYEPHASIPPSVSKTDAEYVEDKKDKVAAHFAETFLNISGISRRVANEAIAKWRKAALVWVPLFALAFAATSFAVTLGVSYIDRRWPSREKLRDEVADDLRGTAFKALEDRIANQVIIEQRLTTRIEELEKKLAEQSRSPQPAKR